MTARSSLPALGLRLLVVGVLGMAAAYASAFFAPPVARVGPWLMAVMVPLTMVATLLLGAMRAGRPSRALMIAFATVFVIVAGGFLLALALPAESADAPLVAGLPRRAAIILLGVGVLPLFLLPLVYAATFDAVTLDDSDLARVRQARRVLPEASADATSHGAVS
jgi:hypothetical protein